MSRIRSIHPGFWTDERFAALSEAAALFYIGLLNEADDQGVFEWKPVTLRMRLRPTKDGSVDPLLDELEGADVICKYEIGLRHYGAIRNFRRYQRPKFPKITHPSTSDIVNYVGSNKPATVIDTVDDEPIPLNAEIPPQMEDEAKDEAKKEISLPSEAPPNKRDDDVRDAVGIYNQAAGRVGWPLAQRVTGARRSACLSRLGECAGLDGWRAAMERAERSEFLRGGNDKGWLPGIDFFLQAKSFTKLMEGSYDDHAGSTGSNGRAHDAIRAALAKAAIEGPGMDERGADPDVRGNGFAAPAEGDREPYRDLEIPDFMRRT